MRRLRRQFRQRRAGLSTIELLAVLAVVSTLVTLIIPRVFHQSEQGDGAVCDVQLGEIETAVEIWRHETGVWPATNLSDIGDDQRFFPNGLPICPVDGTSYTIDSNGRVTGHAH